MKKAKIFLTALTVLAVVGGAVAFKARTINTFATCNPANHICEITPFQSLAATTLVGQFAPYDLKGKQCKQTAPGIFTCETLTFNNG